jgi:DNA-binding response OmpR family regulator
MNSNAIPVVLTADPDPCQREILEALFAKAGWKSVGARTACETALKAMAYHPDLIVLETTFPDGNGPDLCARLRRDPATAGIPIMFRSELNEEFDQIAAFASGADDYTSKTLGTAQIHARALNLIRRR